jgi:hypothetical protein
MLAVDRIGASAGVAAAGVPGPEPRPERATPVAGRCARYAARKVFCCAGVG